MSAQIKRKKKKGNIAGRKNPAFGQTIKRIAIDCLLREQDLIKMIKEHHGEDYEIKKDELGRLRVEGFIPEGVTTVETLYGHQLYVDSRLINHVEMIATACTEFDDFFWEDFGSSICDLRRDRKNRTWGDDQTILQFCYIAIAMDLAEWTKPRTEWKELPGGMPFIKFKGPKRNEILAATQSTKENENVETQHPVQ